MTTLPRTTRTNASNPSLRASLPPLRRAPPPRHCEGVARSNPGEAVPVWIASPTATMLPRVRNDDLARHCERSEAIQGEPSLSGLLHQRQLCCRRFAMTISPVIAGEPPVIASGAKQSRGSHPCLDCFTNGNYVAAGSQ
ncbi:MAG: hypothetical protein LBT00_14750 [Spirochaetaceae bacterium]|nr:hypothetical protein [Spirochaetaceae bacterium]